ncbi:MAG: histidine kinase [Aeromicrobium sp.]
MTWPRLARVCLVGTVVVLFVSAQAQIWTSPPAFEIGGRALNAFVAAAFTFPLIVARVWPLPVLLVVVGAAVVNGISGSELGQPWFAVLLAVYALGAHASAGAAGLGMGAVAGVILAYDIPRLRDGAPIDEVIPAWFIVAGTWGLGRWMQHRRRELDTLTERTEAAEHDRQAAASAAVAHERARIARELHDLVAHSLAVIVLQAQAADRVLDTDPASARRAMEAIDTTGRAGLEELRRLLDLLVDQADDDDLEPRPGLQQLDHLVERVRDAGLPVSVTVEGEFRPLSPGVDLSAYRIVQEALTNTLKHAGRPASATVDVTYRPDAVDIRVVDSGTPATRPPGSNPRLGHGLIGMQERAALYGGRIEAGPLAEGGFGVLATLPTGVT